MVDMTVNNRCGSIEDRATRAACEATPAECRAAFDGESEIYRGTMGQCASVEILSRQLERAKASRSREVFSCLKVVPGPRKNHNQLILLM